MTPRILKSRAFWRGTRDGYLLAFRYLFIPWVVLMVGILAWKAMA